MRRIRMAAEIRLLPNTQKLSLEDVVDLHPDEIVVCDFHVEDIESGERVPGGYQLGRVVNIDHHADIPWVQCHVSSANLALERVAAVGRAPESSLVVITHTDCDSVFSSGIMAGELPADPRFGVAAIAADHTGAENPIADLLQALDSGRDLALSLRNLRLLLSSRALEPGAQGAADKRRRDRSAIEEAVAKGAVQKVGPVALGTFPDRVEGELFPALIPDAVAIVLAVPKSVEPARWIVKVRLGLAAPPGLTLHLLRLTEFDPAYRGRWDAGANKRGGGTAISPEAYAEKVRRRVEAYLSGLRTAPSD